MKKKLIYIFIFNLIIGTTLYAQQPKDSISKSKDSLVQPKSSIIKANDSIEKIKDSVGQVKDSIPKIKKKYGIRLGIDISQPIIALFEKNKHKSLEIIGDIRIKSKYYIAAELGHENKDIQEDFFAYTTSGTFLKVGVNRNFYENWGTMNNEIFVGARYGTSLFKHTLTQYTPNATLNYFKTVPNNKETTFKNLSAHWAELILGVKVETFKNLFLGMNAQFKIMIGSKQPDNFKNMYVPGFRKVSSNNLGFGFTYTISYLIPIIKK